MSIALIGDCHANYEYFKDVLKISFHFGINGLPIWDVTLRDKFDELLKLDDIERIYFSCGHPLMGCKKKDDILSLSDGEFLEFKQEERSFFNKNDYRTISKENLDLLIAQYFRYLEIFTSKDTRIKLLPIAILWHEKVRKTRDIKFQIYEDLKKIPLIDVSVFLDKPTDYINKYGILHPNAIGKLVSVL